MMHWTFSPFMYPDVSSYQQPYFYEHTDPSVYTSPWPPQESDTAYPATANDHSFLAQPDSIPYFPPQHDQADGFDVGLPHCSTFQEHDLGSQDPYINHSQAHDASSRLPAFHLDDASMHLKIQSLPILDNLVRLTHLC